MSSQEEFEALSDAARDDRPLLGVKELAVRLGVSEKQVRNLLAGDDPVMQSFMLGGLRKVEPAEVDRYVARLKGE